MADHWMLNHRQIISQMTWEIFTFGPSLHHRTKSKRLQNQPEWRLLPQDTPAFSLVCFKVGLYYNRLLKHYRGWTQASLTGQGVALGTPEQVKSKASSCQAEEHRGGGHTGQVCHRHPHQPRLGTRVQQHQKCCEGINDSTKTKT